VFGLCSALREVRKALAEESGCSPHELTHAGVHIVARPDERGPRPPSVRRLPPVHPACAILAIGPSAVVSATAGLLAELAPAFSSLERDELFELHHLATVQDVVERFGLSFVGPHLRLVCGADTLRPRAVPDGFRLVLEPDPPIERVREVGQLGWPNAVCARQIAGSLLTMALAIGYRDGDIVGVAAATADAARLWQIGIDVVEDARGRGLGAALVEPLARLVIANDRVPFYGVAPSNLPSLGTALAAGFRPAWTEAYTVAPPSAEPADTAAPAYADDDIAR